MPTNNPLLPSVTPSSSSPPGRRFGDVAALRQSVFDAGLAGLQGPAAAVENDTHRLELVDLAYAGTPEVTKQAQREALLTGRSVTRPLRGTWQLSDRASGEVLDRKPAVVARIPVVSSAGGFIHKGLEYAVKNQQRLRTGVYTRLRNNGLAESFVNVAGGRSHRYEVDGKTGRMFLRTSGGGPRIPAGAMLRLLGVTQSQAVEAWGPEVAEANWADQQGDPAAVEQALAFFGRKDTPGRTPREKLRYAFDQMRLDPEVMEATLGVSADRPDGATMLAVTRKLLAVGRGEQAADDRDDLVYQRLVGPEDLLRDRLSRDRGGLRRSLLWKAARTGSLRGMPSSALQPLVDGVLLDTGLGEPVEQTNPADLLLRTTRVTRMGEGGIGDDKAVSTAARGLHPSHLGFLDPVVTPESQSVGIDLNIASRTRKGEDGKLYTEVRDAKSGDTVWMHPGQLRPLTIGFPEGDPDRLGRVAAMRGGRQVLVQPRELDVVLPSMSGNFTDLANLIPFKSSTAGQRVSMGTRMLTQALPLAQPEAPLVQNADADGRSYSRELGAQFGAARLPEDFTGQGVVESVSPSEVAVTLPGGRRWVYELDQVRPNNRKSAVHQTPVVRPGQRLGPGDLVATSNFTDDQGQVALGLNARVAYLPNGFNYEDALVISEGMAKRLSSRHYYKHRVDKGAEPTSKAKYLGSAVAKLSESQLEHLDEFGVARVGSVLQEDDPVLLATTAAAAGGGRLLRRQGPAVQDAAVRWDHSDPATVVDVVWSGGQPGQGTPTVLTTATREAREADKISNLYGGKGVIAQILPDDQMPQLEDGKPAEVLMNPTGVISRLNSSQVLEVTAARLARKRGEPLVLADTAEGDNTEDLLAGLRAEGLSPGASVYDPVRDRTIKDVLTGEAYILKLHHQAEDKGSSRGAGGYDETGAPLKGASPGGQAKRLAGLESQALLSSGAFEVLKDARSVRGARNDQYWAQYLDGQQPPAPRVPGAYTKFLAELRAAGVDPVRRGTQTRLMAMRDERVEELAGPRRVTQPHTVRWQGDKMEPIPGGLFDPALFGDVGDPENPPRWAAIDLPEPMINPVYEAPVRSLLGLTQAKLADAVAGRGDGPRGGDGIRRALAAMDTDKMLAAERRAFTEAPSVARRDQAARRIGYLKGLKTQGLTPADYMVTRVPVLPPQFRPVGRLPGSGAPVVSDANFLYARLLDAVGDLAGARESMGQEGADVERSAAYHAYRELVGLDKPRDRILESRGVRGILGQVFGKSAKTGSMQYRLLGGTVDQVGRAVIFADPTLSMDEAGIPEGQAFETYDRFIVRALRRRGMSVRQALQEVKDRSPLARKELLKQMEARPVVLSRAPTLHKFGIMAFKPRLVAGDAIRMPPAVYAGFGADNDGDANLGAVVVWLPTAGVVDPAAFFDPETLGDDPQGFLAARRVPELLWGRLPLAPPPGGQVFALDLAEFPREAPVSRRTMPPLGPVDWHRSTQAQVISLAEEGVPVWAGVSNWTCHRRRQPWSVALSSGELVVVDDDERGVLAADAETGRLRTYRPADAVKHQARVPVGTPSAPTPDGRAESAASLEVPASCRRGTLQGRVGLAERVPLSQGLGYLCGCLAGGDPDALDELAVREAVIRARTSLLEVAPAASSSLPVLTGAGCEASARQVDRLLGLLLGSLPVARHLPPMTPLAGVSFAEGLAAGLLDAGETSIRGNTLRLQMPSLRLAREVAAVFCQLGVAATLLPRTPGTPAPLVSIPGGRLRDSSVLSRMKRWDRREQVLGFGDAAPAPRRQAAAVAEAEAGCCGGGGVCAPPAELAELAEPDRPRPSRSPHALAWPQACAAASLNVVADTYDLTVPGLENFMGVDGVFRNNTMNFHVPATDKAAKEAKKKLLVSSHLLSPQDMRSPVHVASQEYIGGLYELTKPRKGRPVRTFATLADARAARERGELGVSDPIRILQKT